MAQRERRQAPEVRRPRGVAWRALQADGLVWEGQVFLVGADVDLAARLIVTRERLALARGGNVILEAPRGWLRPAPRLLPDGNVMVSITPVSDPSTLGNPETLLLRMREGWGDASHVVTLLGGNRSRRRSGAPTDSTRRVPLIPVDPDDPSEEVSHADVAVTPTAVLATRQDPPWSRSGRGQPPIDVPVTAAAEGGRAEAPSREPYVPPPPQAPAVQGRYYDWNLPSAEVVPSRGSRRRRGWVLRLGGLLTLILVAVAVAAFAGGHDPDDQLLEGPRLTEPAGVGGIAGPATETATAATPGSDTVTATVDPAAGPGDDRGGSLPAAGNEETAVALGVGSDLSPTSTSAPVEAPPVLPTDAVPTETPASEDEAAAPAPTSASAATQEGDETATVAATATEPPTATPAATATPAEPTAPAPTTAPPTATPVAAVVATSTQAPEPRATATAAPLTATPAPPTPTVAPSPTLTPPPPPPATATSAPPTATPVPAATSTAPPPTTPAFPTQAPSVAGTGYTAPAFEDGAFRLTVESTMKGSSLPSLGLPANPYGDWLVAVVYVYNWSDAPANLSMQNFGLATADPAVSFMPLDSGTSLVGGALGFELPLGSTDVVVFTPGEGHRLGLLFTADPNGSGFSLEYGSAVVGLQSSLASSPGASDLAAPPADPTLLEATVTDVVDGDTITVEVDGVETAVTYVGVRAPQPNACYGPEATAANAAIAAAGDTVYLEREATDAAADGALLRDVWIDLDGASVLIANELAAVGAVDVLTDTANDRFSSWLEVTVANAAFQGLGVWGTCGGEVGDGSGGVATTPANAFALLPQPPALTGGA